MNESERTRWAGESRPETGPWVSRAIKWTSELEAHLRSGTKLSFNPSRIRPGAYRPFFKTFTYYDRAITHRLYQQDSIFPVQRQVENRLIVCTDPAAQKPWMALSVTDLPDLHFVGAAAGTHCLPRYRYTPAGERIDNITDWALKEFQKAYGKGAPPSPLRGGIEGGGRERSEPQLPPPGSVAASGLASPTSPQWGGKGASPITKDDIFHYVYGVLHDPVYREKYAINLKREFPRIPFYPDFRQWAEWGAKLMELHIGYESVVPWPLDRLDTPDEKAREAGVSPKAMLKADKDNGIIRLDSETQLSGIPPEVWTYKLGNRSGLEWILDQYKEKTPKDPTIREKFNTYRFADYKEKVIDLLMRVTRVSVETVAISEAMKRAKR